MGIKARKLHSEEIAAPPPVQNNDLPGQVGKLLANILTIAVFAVLTAIIGCLGVFIVFVWFPLASLVWDFLVFCWWLPLGIVIALVGSWVFYLTDNKPAGTVVLREEPSLLRTAATAYLVTSFFTHDD